MFEKVNPKHPDKIADRIAGMIVDIAYNYVENPKVAAEVLIGHNECYIIVESDFNYDTPKHINYIKRRVKEISGNYQTKVVFRCYPQDQHLSKAQRKEIVCGDNGIFKGAPTTMEQQELTKIAKGIYARFNKDGKCILDENRLVICQSNATHKEIEAYLENNNCKDYPTIINPIGYWIGGINVDTGATIGATNRKLGSDMGDAVTGGGLHGKDLSKADVTLNIYAHIMAQEKGEVVELSCATGDTIINGWPYRELVEFARQYIKAIGGFEKFAEWGLIR